MGDRRSTHHQSLVLSAVVAVAAWGSPSAAAPIPGERFVVASGPHDKYGPTAGGSIVIWQEIPGLGVPGRSADVLGYDVATGQPFVVGAGPGDEYPGGTDGRTIAWGDLSADGFFVRPVTGGPARHFPLAVSPRVAGDLVAYGVGPGDTMRVELASLSGAPVRQPPDRPGRQSSHDLSDRYLAWEDDPGDSTRRTVRAFDLRDGRSVVVSSGNQPASAPAVSGGGWCGRRGRPCGRETSTAAATPSACRPRRRPPASPTSAARSRCGRRSCPAAATGTSSAWIC